MTISLITWLGAITFYQNASGQRNLIYHTALKVSIARWPVQVEVSKKITITFLMISRHKSSKTPKPMLTSQAQSQTNQGTLKDWRTRKQEGCKPRSNSKLQLCSKELKREVKMIAMHQRAHLRRMKMTISMRLSSG